MRVGEFGEQVKVLLEVWRGVTEWSEDEDSFLLSQRLRGGDDRIQIDSLDTRAVDLDGFVVVEYDGRLKMVRP